MAVMIWLELFECSLWVIEYRNIKAVSLQAISQNGAYIWIIVYQQNVLAVSYIGHYTSCPNHLKENQS
jgi:hypothetical protein